MGIYRSSFIIPILQGRHGDRVYIKDIYEWAVIHGSFYVTTYDRPFIYIGVENIHKVIKYKMMETCGIQEIDSDWLKWLITINKNNQIKQLKRKVVIAGRKKITFAWRK